MLVDIGRIREAKGESLSALGTVALAGPLGQGVTVLSPVQVEATVINTGRFFHVEGIAAVNLGAECVRCLAPVELDLAIPFAQDFSRDSFPAAGEETETEFLPLIGDTLDLGPVVSEAVILALPMKPLCQQNCPGLCPECGQNLKEGKCVCASKAGHSGLADLARLLPKKEV